jgi:hypothetical protein
MIRCDFAVRTPLSVQFAQSRGYVGGVAQCGRQGQGIIANQRGQKQAAGRLR